MPLRSVARSIVFASLPARAKVLLPFLAYSSSPSKSIARARCKISVRTEENFRTYENIFSYVRKFIFLRKKIRPPSNVDFSPSARRKIFVRTEENFLPQENLFPCGRKNIFLRKEIWASSERKFYALRKAKNFLPQGKKFPHMRKYFFVYTEINFLICGNFIPCKPAGNAGRVERVDSGQEKPSVDTSSPLLPLGKEGATWLEEEGPVGLTRDLSPKPLGALGAGGGSAEADRACRCVAPDSSS